MKKYLDISDGLIKRYRRAAIISAPIIALYTVTPFLLYVSSVIEANQLPSIPLYRLVGAMVIMTLNALLTWTIVDFIFHHKKLRFSDTSKYIFCYALAVSVSSLLIFNRPEAAGIVDIKNFQYYPFIGSIGNLTVILLLMRGIRFHYELATLRLEKTRSELANLQSQHKFLRQQIHPHFLFNALANIEAWTAKEPEVAAGYIRTLSSFLRKSTSGQIEDLATLQFELDLMREYIQIQKMRFGEAIVLQCSLQPEHYSSRIPSFTLQLLVENAIKHNTFNLKKPLEIAIDIEEDKLIVTNSLQPLTHKFEDERVGTGLRNLNERLRLSGLEPLLTEESTTSFKVTIPLAT